MAKGDVVAVLMKNSAAFVEIAIAVGHVGAVFLPINYRLSADEVRYIVENSGARLLIADQELDERRGAGRQRRAAGRRRPVRQHAARPGSGGRRLASRASRGICSG